MGLKIWSDCKIGTLHSHNDIPSVHGSGASTLDLCIPPDLATASRSKLCTGIDTDRSSDGARQWGVRGNGSRHDAGSGSDARGLAAARDCTTTTDDGTVSDSEEAIDS